MRTSQISAEKARTVGRYGSQAMPGHSRPGMPCQALLELQKPLIQSPHEKWRLDLWYRTVLVLDEEGMS